MRYQLYLFFCLFIAAGNVFANSGTNAAVLTRIDLVRSNGFMIFGSFGTPSNCSFSDRVYVPKDHPQYNGVYSMALTAFSSGKKL